MSILMKTQGEIEATISEGIGRFEQEYMGQGPKNIRAYLLKDLLVVRLHGALNAAEQHLRKPEAEICSNNCENSWSRRDAPSW